jgi:predicted MPP superfamily phosphohydrolase
MEWTLARAYRGDWPARLAHRLALHGSLRVIRHRVGWDREDTLRLAFASDLHAGPTTPFALIEQAVDALEAANADVVLLGGDFVFLSSRDVDKVADRLREVRASRGKFAVMGNHDLWADDRHITRALERAGVRVLVNERVVLPSPFDEVSICGVDDPWTGDRDTAPAFAGIEPHHYAILLAHAPEALLTIGDARWDLGLCGHTHGGHIALPGGVPIIVPGPLSRRYAHGRFPLDATRTLIVSRGVGSTESPVRWNADPDVLVIDLSSA